MRASLKGSNQGEEGAQIDEQKHLFVENVDVDVKTSNASTHVHTELIKRNKQASCCPNMTPFILMIALSTHSLFEGLAAGLAMNLGSLLNIVAAIVIHKAAAACSLGISLVKTFPNDFKLCRWLILTFSLATPLGMAIGMIAANGGDLVNVVCSSLAAGSFLYIACSEIIVEEFSLAGYRYLKLLAFLCGAMIITLLWFLDS